MNHAISNQWWGKAGARADTREDPAIGYAALTYRNPARDELIRRRVDYGLAGSKKKTDRHKQKPCTANTCGN
jgi:hypothetical protein